jgi:antitoxin (DNA-binding transcriptional repressor) of toxin-antitoxin stability system
MKQISIHETGKNLSKLLKDLPVEITNHGKPVAWLVEPDKAILVASRGKDFLGSDAVTIASPKVTENIPLRKEKTICEAGIFSKNISTKSFIATATKVKPLGKEGLCRHGYKKGYCRIASCSNYRGS